MAPDRIAELSRHEDGGNCSEDHEVNPKDMQVINTSLGDKWRPSSHL